MITYSIIVVITDGGPAEIDLVGDGIELELEIGDAGWRDHVQAHAQAHVHAPVAQ